MSEKSIEDQLEDFENLEYRMGAEGFHYCFDGYSHWKNIDDEKFQELRSAYLKAAEALESYIDNRVAELREQANN